jgi:hypothetical protein
MSEQKSYTVVLRGCDDTTVMKFDLREDEVALLKRIAASSEQTSTYGCMPRLEVFEGEPPREDWWNEEEEEAES